MLIILEVENDRGKGFLFTWIETLVREIQPFFYSLGDLEMKEYIATLNTNENIDC